MGYVCGACCVLLVTLLCWASIQNMLGSLCRRIPLLYTSRRSPERRSPGPQTTLFALEGPASEMVSAPDVSKPNSSPGSRTEPTLAFKRDNILALCSHVCRLAVCLSVCLLTRRISSRSQRHLADWRSKTPQSHVLVMQRWHRCRHVGAVFETSCLV